MASSEDEKPKARRRRANGDGTTWQDKDGQWWAALRFETGRRPYKVRAKTRQDAETKLRDLRKRRDAAVNEPNAQTVADWLEVWMRDVVIVHAKRKTVLYYRDRIENGINPTIGHIRLDALKPDHIRAMQAQLSKVGQSPVTVNGAHTTLSTALQVAVNDRKIVYNAARSVKKLRVVRQEIIPLTTSEVAALFWAIEGHRLEAMYHLAFLGLRLGELLGLRITDIDLAAGTLRVTQQAVSLENSHMVIETPKTENAKRVLPLSPYLTALLRQRLEMLLVERGRSDWEEHGLLFPSERGTIISHPAINLRLERTLACAGITRPWTWHKFRHTVVSWLTDLGITDEIIKSIVGHSGKDVTDRYRHISLEPKCRAFDLLQETYLKEVYTPDQDQEQMRRRQQAGAAPHKKQKVN